MDFLKSAAEMRAKAWAELVASDAFRAFRASDNMVVELGGASAMPDLSTVERAAPKPIINPRPRFRAIAVSRRLSQTDAALQALTAAGHPLHINNLTDRSKALGATIGGSNPIANFRSALSKDDRFFSFRRDGGHWWWTTTISMPENWKEAADPDLLDQSAASDASDQEGGDSHAATTVT